MVSEFVLQTGVDFPFREGRLVIHQPSIKEIAQVTLSEENFYMGCNYLNLDKRNLDISDKTILEELTNFEIIMSMMNNFDVQDRSFIDNVMNILYLICPNYQIEIKKDKILFIKDDIYGEVNRNNFEMLKNIINKIFVLKDVKGEIEEYNPIGDLSREIAEKLRKGKEKREKLKNSNDKKISILSRYISILSVGLKKDKNELLKYTIPQLFDEFNRFQLKEENDIYIKAKMAGAQDLKDIDPWMKDLYSS